MSDVTLAASDVARRRIYAELAEARGISIRALESAVEGLRDQLDRERQRADSAEQQLAAVQTELVGARVEAAGLRGKLVEAGRPKRTPASPPRTVWRRVLRALGHTR